MADPAGVASLLNSQEIEAPSGLFLYGQQPGQYCYLLYRPDRASDARALWHEFSEPKDVKVYVVVEQRVALPEIKHGSVRDRGGERRTCFPERCETCQSALYLQQGRQICPNCGPDLGREKGKPLAQLGKAKWHTFAQQLVPS